MKKPPTKTLDQKIDKLQRSVDRILKMMNTGGSESVLAKDTNVPTSNDAVTETEDNLSIYFPPDMNMAKIWELSKGKNASGDKLYWDFDDAWMKKEKFFTEEYCKEGWKILDKKWIGAGKNWNDCKELAEKEGKRMLNYAEFFYLVWKCPEIVKKLTWYENRPCYTWLSTPVRGYVGYAGDWDSNGPSRVGVTPGVSGAAWGWCSPALIYKIMRHEIMSSEMRIALRREKYE